MSHAKQASTKRKRSINAVPVLGAAGLSLSLAGGASAATGGPTADMLTGTGVSQEITLCEEQISDVSLATFYVFDNEAAGAFQRSVRTAQGCEHSGCSFRSTSTDYRASSLRSYANPPRYSIKPARKYAQTPKRKHVSKKP
jgi:hypothetical protein